MTNFFYVRDAVAARYSDIKDDDDDDDSPVVPWWEAKPPAKEATALRTPVVYTLHPLSPHKFTPRADNKRKCQCGCPERPHTTSCRNYKREYRSISAVLPVCSCCGSFEWPHYPELMASITAFSPHLYAWMIPHEFRTALPYATLCTTCGLTRSYHETDPFCTGYKEGKKLQVPFRGVTVEVTVCRCDHLEWTHL